MAKQYVGKPGDSCFFNRCNFCNANFVIEEEFEIHLKRCYSFHKEFEQKIQEAGDIFENLPNMEGQC